MITNPAQVTRHHMANQAAPAYSLIRKVCDLAALDRLVAAGFVRSGAALLDLRYFHATQHGCQLAGLSCAGMARATGAKT